MNGEITTSKHFDAATLLPSPSEEFESRLIWGKNRVMAVIIVGDQGLKIMDGECIESMTL
jgi:hypothetical protein